MASEAMPWEADPIVTPATSGGQPWESDPIVTPADNNPIVDAVKYTARGVTRGLGQTAGAPVDLANAAIAGAGQAMEGYQDVAEGVSERLGVPYDRKPPMQPSAAPVGGSQQIVGLAADAGLTERSSAEVPEDYRPFAVGGEVVGQSVPIAAAPLAAAARAGTKAATGITAPIVNAARTSPGTFAAAEAGGATGAGLGGAAAEAVAPGDETARFVGEVVGGTFTPVAIVTRAAKTVTDGLGRFRRSFTKSGREQAAAERVGEILRAGGEDPTAVADALKAPSEVDAPYTAGQKSGSPSLLALERKLIQEVTSLGPEVQQATKDSIEAVNRSFRDAMMDGSPEALRQVAQAREEWFKSLIAQRLDLAKQKGEKAVARLRGQMSRNRPAANRRAKELLEEAIADAREQERALWQRVDRNIPVEAKGTLDSYDRVRSELLDEEDLPAPVEAFLSRVRQSITPLPGRNAEPPTVSTGDLFRFRSRLLAMARDARSKGENALNRQLMILADGALDDLDTLVGERAQAARSFSRSLNEQLNRGYPAQVLGVDRKGAEKVPSDLTLEKGVAGGGPAADIRGREMEQAVTPVPGGPGLTAARGEAARARPAEMRAVQEDVLRDVASNVINPTTGRVSADRLSRWLSDNESVLERFPGLRSDLADAESAERALESYSGVAKRAVQASKQAAFAKVAGFEDPTAAVRNALKSQTPAKEFGALVKLANRGGEDAVSGLRAAVFDHLFGQAAGKNGMISGAKLSEALEKPVSPGNPSLLQMMRTSGALKGEQVSNLRRLIGEAKRLESALETTGRIDDVIDEPSAVFDLMTRVIGANIGGAGVVGQASGAPIVAAGAGSRFAQKIFNKVPQNRIRDVLAEAVVNPKLMEALLRRAPTPRAKRNIERQINAYLIQAGIIPDDSERSAPQGSASP